jgi:hypothetical protein
MASQVNVYAELTAVGVDVLAGSTQNWTTTGLGYGQMVWYVAWPLTLVGAPGNNEFEVTHVSCEATADGNHLVNLSVTSKGTNDFGSYGLYVLYTDVIQ